MILVLLEPVNYAPIWFSPTISPWLWFSLRLQSNIQHLSQHLVTKIQNKMTIKYTPTWLQGDTQSTHLQPFFFNRFLLFLSNFFFEWGSLF